MKNPKTNVTVIGAGFAGVELVKHLDAELFDILLIDRVNHHQFQPLFYQVATSQIEPSSISFPLRHIFRRQKNVQIRLADVYTIEHDNKKIITGIGSFDYDILVIAIGCKTNFFGNTQLSQNVFTLKTTYEAITIRNHILQTFENIISSNEKEKESLLNLCIVGAGPTGVELAGTFAEIRKNVLPRDYRGIDFSKFRIILVEGSKDTLNSMSELAKKSSRKYLSDMGVTILSETFVKNYDGLTLELNNGNTIQTRTVIWAAGVTGNTLEGLPEESKAQGNRIRVDRYNSVNGVQSVYALGDIAYMETPLYPRAHPQVANVAIHQARNLARNLKRLQNEKPLKPFEYRNLGSMATIGRNKAVVDFPFIRFKGYLAWLIWMFLHLMLILSVRNKLIIFINWAWAYITKDSALRLILKQGKSADAVKLDAGSRNDAV